MLMYVLCIVFIIIIYYYLLGAGVESESRLNGSFYGKNMVHTLSTCNYVRTAFLGIKRLRFPFGLKKLDEINLKGSLWALTLIYHFLSHALL